MLIGTMYLTDGNLNVHKDFDEVLKFPLAASDLIISGYPKSGTNWVQIMLANLWDDWATTQNRYRRVPNIAGADRGDYQGYLACVSAESPRLMKSHLHEEAMPHAWPDNGKVIHVTRDPRDVCVSQFFMLKHLAEVYPEDPDAETDWDTWVERFVDGRITCGSYLNAALGWHRLEHPNLMKVHYEDLKEDPESFLRAAAEFLGREVSEDRIVAVARDTHPSRMRANESLRAQINVPAGMDSDDRPFIRTGTSGGWPEHLSGVQLRSIEERILSPMIAAGIGRYAI